MAKTAGEAFDSIKQLLDDLSDVLHKSQLFRKDQGGEAEGLVEGEGVAGDDAGGGTEAATGGEGEKQCLKKSFEPLELFDDYI